MEKKGAGSGELQKEFEAKAEEQGVQEKSSTGPSADEEEENKKKKKMKKVLAAIDESQGSLYALTWALTNLFPDSEHASATTAIETTTLVLLHVQQPFQQYIFPAGPGVYATSAVIESARKAQQHNSEALLARALELCRGRPLIKVESIVLDGEPKETICQVAEQIDADLLVVGSRGLGTIKRAFLGSVSDYSTHHAKCPVLVVRPPPKSDKKE